MATVRTTMAKSSSMGRTFAVIGAVYAGSECAIEKVRKDGILQHVKLSWVSHGCFRILTQMWASSLVFSIEQSRISTTACMRGASRAAYWLAAVHYLPLFSATNQSMPVLNRRMWMCASHLDAPCTASSSPCYFLRNLFLA